MKNILLIENNNNLLYLYKKELSDLGYRVIVSPSGEQALPILNGENVDLIVFEIQPTANQEFQTLEKMLNIKENLKIVINTTSGIYKNDISSRLAHAYLIKSSDLSELKVTIDELLKEN